MFKPFTMKICEVNWILYEECVTVWHQYACVCFLCVSVYFVCLCVCWSVSVSMCDCVCIEPVQESREKFKKGVTANSLGRDLMNCSAV